MLLEKNADIWQDFNPKYAIINTSQETLHLQIDKCAAIWQNFDSFMGKNKLLKNHLFYLDKCANIWKDLRLNMEKKTHRKFNIYFLKMCCHLAEL